MCGKAGQITLFALFAQFSVVLTRACPPVALRLRKPGDPPKFLPLKTVFTLAQNRISEVENDIKSMIEKRHSNWWQGWLKIASYATFNTVVHFVHQYVRENAAAEVRAWAY